MVRPTVATLSTLVFILCYLPVNAQNVTAADTWPGYDLLRPCEKWCYTACRDPVTPSSASSITVSVATSPSQVPSNQCSGPILYPVGADPQGYEGFVSSVNCSSAQCIC